MKARELNLLDGLGVHGLCWWKSDASWDVEAKKVLLPGQFIIMHGMDAPNSYRAVCASSASNIYDPNHLHYTVDIH